MVVLDLSNADPANAEARYTANGMVILPLLGEMTGVRFRQNEISRFEPLHRGTVPGSAGVWPASSDFWLPTGRRDAGVPKRFMGRASVNSYSTENVEEPSNLGCCPRLRKPVRATAAKEVGMKDPAEKTTVRPNQNLKPLLSSPRIKKLLRSKP
jgi:hypothetical protein